LPEHLSPIPFVDVRQGGTLEHARLSSAGARALRDACVNWFPSIARPLIPVGDWFARRWLMRSQSPYIGEVQAIAAALGFPGIWFLNGSYQWSCTSCARDEDGAPWLARTLDWPFPGLGRHVEVAMMSGASGEYLNVTWPGYVGALTASAPGRFAASINQAPMKRRTESPKLRLVDLAVNAVSTFLHVRAIPPDQLLRQIFEECADYAEAKHRLECTPIARPVIYTLVGCAPGERCVIERTETGVRARTHDTGAANDWLESMPNWEGRLGSDRLLNASTEEAADNSRARREAFAGWPGRFAGDSFAWVAPPVLNPYTRLAAEMCPARGILRVVGYELAPGEDLPEPATLPFELGDEKAAA
jgi:hypothetical protein